MNNYEPSDRTEAAPAKISWIWETYLPIHKCRMYEAIDAFYRRHGFPGRFDSTPFACQLDDAPYCRLTCSLSEQYLIKNESRANDYGAAPTQNFWIEYPSSLYESLLFEATTPLYICSYSWIKEQLEESLAQYELDELIERNYQEGLADWLFTAILSISFMLLFIWSNQAGNLPLASFSLLASLFLWLAADLTHRAF